jgi:hypothetical protein
VLWQDDQISAIAAAPAAYADGEISVATPQPRG